MATYEDFQSYLSPSGVTEADFSQEDLALARANPDAGIKLVEAKYDWKTAKTDDERAMANAQANSIREQYGGYSGGIDGMNGNVSLTDDDLPGYTGEKYGNAYTNDQILGSYNQPYAPIQAQGNAVDNPYDDKYYVQSSAVEEVSGPKYTAAPHQKSAGELAYEAQQEEDARIAAEKTAKKAAKAETPAYQYEAPAVTQKPAYQYQAPVQQEVPAYQYQAPTVEVAPYMENYEDPYEITQTPASYQSGPAPDPFSYDKTAPTYQPTGEYTNKYADQQAQMLGDITNYKDFSFDPETNPQMMAYKKQYTREGNRAMRDTMGTYAGMTGGIPSTAAVSAAQQANNNYMSQLGDRLPEVYANEYNRYLQEFNMLQDKYGAVNQAENIDYSRYWDGENFNWEKYQADRDQYNLDRNQAFGEYQSNLGQYNTDRDFGYGQAMDDISYKTNANDTAYNRAANADEVTYGRGRDSVADQMYAQEQYRLANETQYNRGRDTVADQNYAQEQYRLQNDTDYGRGRDSVYDQNYTQEQNRISNETDYTRGRDAVDDTRYADETTYNRGIYADETAYNRGRDTIADEQFESEQNRLKEEAEFDRKYKIDEQNASAETDEYNRAIDRFEMIGYADSQTAEILGVPEGSVWGGEATELALRQSKLDLLETQAKINNINKDTENIGKTTGGATGGDTKRGYASDAEIDAAWARAVDGTATGADYALLAREGLDPPKAKTDTTPSIAEEIIPKIMYNPKLTITEEEMAALEAEGITEEILRNEWDWTGTVGGTIAEPGSGENKSWRSNYDPESLARIDKKGLTEEDVKRIIDNPRYAVWTDSNGIIYFEKR